MSLQRKSVPPVRSGDQRIVSNSGPPYNEAPSAEYIASRSQVSLPPNGRLDETDLSRTSYRRPLRQPQPTVSWSQPGASLPPQFPVRSNNDGSSSVSASNMMRSIYEHDENLEGDRKTGQSYMHTQSYNTSTSSASTSVINSATGGSRTSQRDPSGVARPTENGQPRSRQRRLFVMRHGERCDFALGRNWLEFLGAAFGKSGAQSSRPVRRPSLNIPAKLPARTAMELGKDPPLTEIGLFQARKTGFALAEAGVRLTHVYASPALRCIQTGVEVLRGMREYASSIGLDLLGPRICIEPGLFEWCGWYKTGMPIFMTVDQLQAFDSTYPIDPTYRPHFDIRRYNVAENTEEYFRRSADTIDAVLAHAAASSRAGYEAGWIRGASARAGPTVTLFEGDEILVIGHAGSLHTCTRRITGRGELRGQGSTKHFKELAGKVPYCGLCAAEESSPGAPNKWRLIDPPCPTFVHSANAPFDWRILA